MEEALNKTLIIRFSSIGDIVLSSLLLRAMRRRFPGMQIDYLVKEEFAELVRHNPDISRVIEFPTGGTMRHLRHMRRDILRERYDLVLDIHDSLRSRLLCLGHHRVERIRKRKFRRFVLVTTKWNLYPDPPLGVAERYLETVHSLGVTNDGQGLDIHVPAHAQEQAREVLRAAGVEEGERLIGICPAAKHANKMWFKDRFAEVASTLARERNAAVVLFGSAEERPRCEEISAMIGQQAPDVRVANLAGQLSLLETAAAMDRCLVVVCNDSGLMHIAAARKRAVVAVFGPTVREFGFFPYSTSHAVVEYDGLFCRPCTHIGLSRCPKGHFNCMAGIPGDRVVAAARQLLGN